MAEITEKEVPEDIADITKVYEENKNYADLSRELNSLIYFAEQKIEDN